MSKIINVLAPLTIIAISLTSCGNTTDNEELISRIQRFAYTPITENVVVEAHNRLTEIKHFQTEGKETIRLRLLNSGSMNTTLETLIKGSYTYDESKIDDINLSVKTQYEMSWNQDKKYIEYRSDNTSWYIVKDKYGSYWSAHPYLVRGKEVKGRVLLDFDDNSFVNYLRKSIASRALILEDMEIGMSGLGYVPDFSGIVRSSISGLFNTEDGYIYHFYDVVNRFAGDRHNCKAVVAKNESDPYSFSGEVLANLDLAKLKSNIKNNFIEDEDIDVAYMLLAMGLEGKLSCDLFTAWKDALVCQQEYIVKGKDIDITGSYDSHFVDISGNFDIYFGEENQTSYDVSDEQINKILNEYPVLY